MKPLDSVNSPSGFSAWSAFSSSSAFPSILSNRRDPKPSGKVINQHILVRQGINTDLARKIVKMIKDKRMKVQAAIQGDKVRVTGKKRDDLQQVMAIFHAWSNHHE